MAGQILITPETMRGRANEFRREAGHIEEVIGAMDRLLGQLEGEWKGEAQRAYSNRYRSELKPNFQKARDLANEIARALDDVATNQENADNASKGIFG